MTKKNHQKWSNSKNFRPTTTPVVEPTLHEGETAFVKEEDVRKYDHPARPDDLPEPGDRCKVCGEDIVWIGPDTSTDWLHVDDEENNG